METPKPKLNINTDNEELKIYMFTVQSGVVHVAVHEDVKAVLAYNDNGAVEMVRKDYATGVMINLSKRAEVPVREIVDAVNLQPDTPMKILLDTPPPQTKEKSINDFLYGLLLIKDQYIKIKKDKTALENIIKRIKICQ